MTRSGLLALLATAGAYVAVAALTAALSPRLVVPLFDGFAPAPAYRWVKPPPELRARNRKPASAQHPVALTRAGSRQAFVSTPDGQASLTLDTGAIAPHRPDTRALITLTPLDAGALAPLPAGLRADGNAYRVSISCLPSGEKTTLRKPVMVALVAARGARAFLYSREGRSWGRLPSAPPGDASPQRSDEISAPGYVVVASTAPQATGGGGGGKAVALIVLAVLTIAVIVAIPVGARRAGGPGE